MINRIVLLLKGMAMGGADVIPGVSGGTIALITGIYEQLIDSIRSVDASLIRPLFKFQVKTIWERINGAFLLNVLLGIMISIFSLARLITYLLDQYPIQVWSFFFGLILISVYYVLPPRMNVKTLLTFIAGAAIAYVITSIAPGETTESIWFVFLSGAIAICAMILPGISGSFILLLLGKYDYVLTAVKNFDLAVIAVFGAGCVVGIVSFSKLIHWLLENYKAITMAMLAGFMLGSLNKIWPWKVELDNVLPATYASTTGMESYLLGATLSFLIGILIVVVLERTGRKIQS